MDTLIFEVTPWFDLMVWRQIEIKSSQTVYDLHDAIQDAFLLEPDHLHAFFMNNHPWDMLMNVGDGNAATPSNTTSIGKFDWPLNKLILYISDFGDELRHSVKLVARGKSKEDVHYPRVIAKNGNVPLRYHYTNEEDLDSQDASTSAQPPEIPPLAAPFDEELRALLPTLKSTLSAYWDRHELHAEGKPPAPQEEDALKAEQILCLKMIELCNTDNAVIHLRVEHKLDIPIRSWFMDLSPALAKAELFNEAVLLARQVANLGTPARVHRDIPTWLQLAGDTEGALTQIEYNLDQYPQDYKMLLEVARTLLLMEKNELAEQHLREALHWSGSDKTTRTEIVNTLELLLQAQGRSHDIDQLRQEERLVRRKIQELGPFADIMSPPKETIQRVGAKVGRNDPCPCGSGKKYKKCCQ